MYDLAKVIHLISLAVLLSMKFWGYFHQENFHRDFLFYEEKDQIYVLR